MPNPRSQNTLTRAIQLSIRGLLFEQLCFTQFTYAVAIEPQPAAPNLANFLTLWEGEVMDMWLSGISQDYTISGLSCRELTDPARGGEFLQPIGPPVGAVAVASLPSICACCVSWQTGLFGRCGRGRTFWPGIPSDGTTEGVLTNAHRLTMVAAAGNIAATPITLGTLDYRLYLVSPASSSLDTGIVKGEQVSSFTVRTSVSSVRRRKVGQGA